MRDGISRPELDATVKALTAGKSFEEAAKQHLSQVDPKVVELNRESMIRMAATELGELLVTPERAELSKKLHAQLKAKPAPKSKEKDPPAPAAPAKPAADDIGDIE